MMNKIKGYKAFTNMNDRYGNHYELDKEYVYEGDITFGKSGFHFCEHLEDVFRYYDGFDDSTVVCEVEGYGNIVKYDDEFYQYFDMYVASKIKILKILSREDMIKKASDFGVLSMVRFISGVKLSDEEIDIITNMYSAKMIRDYIDYYQKNDKEVFQRKKKMI